MNQIWIILCILVSSFQHRNGIQNRYLQAEKTFLIKNKIQRFSSEQNWKLSAFYCPTCHILNVTNNSSKTNFWKILLSIKLKSLAVESLTEFVWGNKLLIVFRNLLKRILNGFKQLLRNLPTHCCAECNAELKRFYTQSAASLLFVTM